MSRTEIGQAFLIVWIVLTLVGTMAAAAPLILDAETIGHLTPRCERQLRDGRPCALCGMTTAFLHIGKGEFRQAQSANRASVPVYSAFCLNAAVLAGALGWRTRRRRNP